MADHLITRYARDWLSFGLPTALGAAFLCDIFFPLVFGWTPLHDDLTEAAVFVLLTSLIAAAIWPAGGKLQRQDESGAASYSDERRG